MAHRADPFDPAVLRLIVENRHRRGGPGSLGGGVRGDERIVSNPSDQARLEAVVRGRVQGVGFRWAVFTLAGELGISGRVSNQLDGTVKVMAEGSRSRLEKLASWLSQGPPHAIVVGVEVEWSTPRNRWRRFAIDHI